MTPISVSQEFLERYRRAAPQFGERPTFAQVATPNATAAAAVSKADIAIYQGDDYAAIVDVHNSDGSEANLAGAVPKAQIRQKVADQATTVAAEFACAIIAPSTVTLQLTHLQTSVLSGSYVWDLQLTLPSGVVTTVLAGAVKATQEVTR